MLHQRPIDRARAEIGHMRISLQPGNRAIEQGIVRAAKTLRNVRGAWVKEQHVRCDGGKIVEYQVNMMVTFVLDD